MPRLERGSPKGSHRFESCTTDQISRYRLTWYGTCFGSKNNGGSNPSTETILQRDVLKCLMRFLVYETTNKVNGKKYRGAHACQCEECSYLGSGRLFKKALAKYGPAQFERTILVECSSSEEMFRQEAELVNADWVADPQTYNLKVGGEGGWDFINRNKVRWNPEKRAAHSEVMKQKRKEGTWKPHQQPKGFLGKTHSSAAKQKISKAQRLDPEIVSLRLADMVQCNYPQRGSLQKLSNLWGVSHTQVRRFIMARLSQDTEIKLMLENQPESIIKMIKTAVGAADQQKTEVTLESHLDWFGALSMLVIKREDLLEIAKSYQVSRDEGLLQEKVYAFYPSHHFVYTNK